MENYYEIFNLNQKDSADSLRKKVSTINTNAKNDSESAMKKFKKEEKKAFKKIKKAKNQEQKNQLINEYNQSKAQLEQKLYDNNYTMTISCRAFGFFSSQESKLVYDMDLYNSVQQSNKKFELISRSRRHIKNMSQKITLATNDTVQTSND